MVIQTVKDKAWIHFRLTIRCFKGQGRDKSIFILFVILLSKGLKKSILGWNSAETKGRN